MRRDPGDCGFAASHVGRVLAFLVDVSAVAVVVGGGFLVGQLAGVGSVGVAVVAFVVVFGFWQASSLCLTGGQTVGKALFGFQVVRVGGRGLDQSPKSLGWAACRQTFGYVITDMGGVGCVFALVTKRRRALHDLVFGSEVRVLPDVAADRRERLNAYWDTYRRSHDELERRWRWLFGVWRQLTRIVVLVGGALTVLTARGATVAPQVAQTTPVVTEPAARSLSLVRSVGLSAAQGLGAGLLLSVLVIDGAAAGPVTLQRVDIGQLGPEVGFMRVADVHGDDGGWLAVGHAAEAGDRPVTVVFSSPDGRDWSVEPLPPPAVDVHRAEAVVGLGEDLLVVGVATSGRGEHLVTWRGRPGAWTVEEHDEALGQHRTVRVIEAVAVGDGAVLAGSAQDSSGGWAPRIWVVDADGTVSAARGLDGQEGALVAVATDGRRLLAAGVEGPPAAYQPVVMYGSTDDGRSWEVAEHRGLDRGEVLRLHQFAGTWWIAGLVEGTAEGMSAVWRSEDGMSWNRVSDNETGSSRVSDVVPLGDDVLALGTSLGRLDGRGRVTWRGWPGGSGGGQFETAASHAGTVVAVGTPGTRVSGGLPGLYVSDDGDTWEWVDLAPLVLDPPVGVHRRFLGDIGGSPQRLVLVGGQVNVDGEEIEPEAFLAADPTFQTSVEGASFAGVMYSVHHTPRTGFVAAGSVLSPEGDYTGVRIFRSDDGVTWDLLVSTDEHGDRGFQVVPTGTGALVTGLSYDGQGEPFTLVWRITDHTAERIQPRGLDGWGAWTGCGSGDTVVLAAVSAGFDRRLAISADGGDSFALHDEGPAAESTRACAIAPDGEIAVLAQDPATIHVYRPTDDTWHEVEPPAPGRLDLTHLAHIPDHGWIASGYQGGELEATAVAFLSDDLDDWTEIRVNSDAARTSLAAATVSGDDLYLHGLEDQADAALWTIPLADLPQA